MNGWRAIGMAGLVLTAAAPVAAQFTPGDVFYGGSAGEIHNITGGGDFALVTPFADTGQYSASQFVWSLDLETMYVGHVQVGTVSAIDSSGTVTTFAEGIDGPTGLVMTRDGRLLVAAFNQGEIYDITAGGTLPPEQPPLVTGLNGPRSMVELADGRILVADQFANAVYDIGYPDGGAVGAPFADGHDSPRALAVAPDGTIYVNSDASGGSVYDITTGGAPAV
ncbi:MAG: hypothetical protein KJO07_19765, partial [Deltaproteobacteria bacterium]|nr:hypothetical protein [Deltaproteobacteria bacterium]